MPTGAGETVFDPSGWSNITSFSWDQPTGSMVIDDLEIAFAEAPAQAISSNAFVLPQLAEPHSHLEDDFGAIDTAFSDDALLVV